MSKCKKGEKWDEYLHRCVGPFLNQETTIGLLIAIGLIVAGIIDSLLVK